MSAQPENFKLAVNERGSTTALLYAAPKQKRVGTTFVLGHGAGGNQTSAIMSMFAIGLAARGLDVMTFNFLYTEQGRGAPDPKAKLEACYRAVIEGAVKHKKLKGNRLVIGGKSMGGRIASQVAADQAALPQISDWLAGLVFLGYPLHPPGKPEQMRDQHLKDIRARMLFVQGSRDAFGTPDQLRAVIKRDRLPAALYVIEGGDHSFKVPKSAGVPQQQVYENAMNEIVRWVKLK